jgi:hypothetical protein
MSCIKAELGLTRANYRTLLRRLEKLQFGEPRPAWDKLHKKECDAMGKFGVSEGSIKIDDLYSSRFTIQGCKNGECMVYSRDLRESVKELLAQVPKAELNWFAKKTLHPVTGERIYREVYEGKWMEEEQEKLGAEKPILIIIIASDETHINGKGRSEWPLYIASGNVCIDQRTKAQSKRLIGYIPKVSQLVFFG